MIVQNGERFIRQALDSIFEQSYSPLEIIVVHGESQDKTLDIISEYPDITLIQQKGKGVSDAYNTGIKAARADFVSFLSYDDIWTPDKLSSQMHYMLLHSDIMFTNCLTRYFLEPGIEIPEGIRKQWLTGTHPARIMETLVARKKVFELVGYFNPSLRTAEDVDWYSRASDLKIPTWMLPEALLRKRIHGKNTSMQLEQNNKNLLTALREAVMRKKQTNLER
jgi:glycosyltransferase involved in cell wall biosynthesis